MADVAGTWSTWWLDEMEHAGRENLDRDHIARYDDKEQPDLSSELELLGLLGISSRSVVVDLGAGTGQFVTRAGSVGCRLIAVDPSPPMLARLSAKVAALGLKNVSVVQGGFLSYVHAGPPADLVYSRYALHHLPDFWKALALRRIAGMLRPDGWLRLWDVVYSFDPADAEVRIEDWIRAAAAPDEANGWTRQEVAEHVRDENSTFTWLMEPMLERAGYSIRETEYSADGMFAKYLCQRSGWTTLPDAASATSFTSSR